MTRRIIMLATLLSPLAAHAASVTTPTVIAINTPTAFSITAPSGFTPAPVPNQNVSYRTAPDDGSPKVSAALQSPRVELRQGDGFTPHSNFSEELEMRSRGPTPGLVPSLTIKFPLN
jgi:hypothetical protein